MTPPPRPDAVLLSELAEIVYPYHIMEGLCLLHESAIQGDWFGATLAINKVLGMAHVRRMKTVCAELIQWRERANRLERAKAA